jgi:hypothetical protein
MRIDSPEFAIPNKASDREPLFVVELAFDTANTDLHYFTSGTVDGITGSVISGGVVSISSTSQKISPDKALSTIGSIKFSILDEGFTALQYTKFEAGDGLNGRRVRVYAGYAGLDWSDYQLVQTQVVSQSITYMDGVYSITCSDIQRFTKKKIFEPVETALSASITADQDTIPLFDASNLETVYQLPSAEGKTLLRGMQQSGDYPELDGVDKIGLIILEKGDEFEVALWTDSSGNTLTGVIRGLFGTTPLAITVDGGASSQDAPKVTEYVYLEGPAVKVAYAMTTGAWYGHAGEYLPDHWHCGISTDYVASSSYVNIGVDLWDLTDDDKGFPIVIRNPGEQEAKKFIEEQIFYLLGVFPRIRVTGELGLKRLSYISAGGGYSRLLNTDNIESYNNLREDLKVVRNSFALKWNWDERRELYSRTSVLIDSNSIDRHQQQPTKVVKLRTLSSSRHSDKLIREHFNNLRVRYANPPYRLSLKLTPDQNDLEVGDVVRVNLEHIQDKYSNTTLDRNFEVQSVQINWTDGTVSVQLFATTSRASDILPDETETVSSAFVSYEGTEINATNFPSNVSSSGGTTTISGDITLSGHTDATNAAAVYYCTEDLIVGASATVTVTQNVQIRVDGFLQVNGKIDGKGQGLAGGVAETSINTLNANYSGTAALPSQCQGLSAVGTTVSQRGLWTVTGFWNSSDSYVDSLPEIDGTTIIGDESVAPALTIAANGELSGLPSELRGSSGSAGRMSYQYTRTRSRHNEANSGQWIYVTSSPSHASSGSGGNGGAGLAVFSAGMSIGASGEVDLSGADGVSGNVEPNLNLAAGAGGGGAPGVFVYGILDSAQSFPDVYQGFTLNHGISPQQGRLVTNILLHNIATEGGFTGSSTQVFSSRYVGADSTTHNLIDQNAHIVFMDTRQTPEVELPPYVAEKPQFTLTEYRNTPSSAAGNISTIEVSVTAPSASNYSYSKVGYRKQGDSAFIDAPPAAPESLVQLPSDGETYEFTVLAVSVSGFTSQVGNIETITTTDMLTRSLVQLQADFPFAAITGAALDIGGSDFLGLEPTVFWNDSNADLGYFSHWEVDVYAGAVFLRTESSSTNHYTYSYQKNRSDYYGENAEVGVFLDIEFRIRAVSNKYDNSATRYKGSDTTFSVSATTTNDPQNLRFYTHIDVNDERINNNNATPYTLAINGNVDVTGSKVVCNGSGSWTDGVYSLESYTNGAFISFKVLQSDKRFIVGFNDDPAATLGYVDFDYSLYFQANNSFIVWRNNSGFSAGISCAEGDVLTLAYDGLEFKTHKNGILVHSMAADPNLKLYLDSTFLDTPSGFEALSFGPLTAATDYEDDRVNNNNATPYTLVSTANMQVTGAKVTCLSAADWVESVYSEESHTGGAFVSFRISATDKRFMLGLNSDPATDDSYLSIDYAIYIRETGNFQVHENGTDAGLGDIACVAGDVFTIFYDNVSVRYYQNGALIQAITANPNLKLYLDSSFRDTGAEAEALNFGPFAQAADWLTNIVNIPDELTPNATTGLNLTATHLGYYDGSQWQTFIDNNGDFRFGDLTSGQYLEFSGGVLAFGPNATIGKNDNVTVTVGPTGNYATLNLALEALSKVVPAYKNGGFTATISILSGYVETETIHIDGLNLGWITIEHSSGDTGVLSVNGTSLGSDAIWFLVTNGGVAPVINTSVTFLAGGAGFQAAFKVDYSSTLRFAYRGEAPTNPIKIIVGNADYTVTVGLHALNGGFIDAKSVHVIGGSDVLLVGIKAETSATIESKYSLVDKANNGINAIDMAVVNAPNTEFVQVTGRYALADQCGRVDVSNSVVTGVGTATEGITSSNGAFLTANNCDFSGCSTAGLTVNGGYASVRNSDLRINITSDSAFDKNIWGGGVVYGAGSNGGSTLTPNTMDADGVLFGQ